MGAKRSCEKDLLTQEPKEREDDSKKKSHLPVASVNPPLSGHRPAAKRATAVSIQRGS